MDQDECQIHKKALAILSEGSYTTRVSRAEDGVISVFYPSNTLEKARLPAHTVFYLFGKDTIQYGTDISEDTVQIEVPNYAHRAYVQLDIGQYHDILGLSTDFVECHRGDCTGGTIWELLGPPGDLIEQEREDLLLKLFVQGKALNFPDCLDESAETQGITAGYKILKSFFEES